MKWAAIAITHTHAIRWWHWKHTILILNTVRIILYMEPKINRMCQLLLCVIVCILELNEKERVSCVGFRVQISIKRWSTFNTTPKPYLDLQLNHMPFFRLKILSKIRVVWINLPVFTSLSGCVIDRWLLLIPLLTLLVFGLIVPWCCFLRWMSSIFHGGISECW